MNNLVSVIGPAPSEDLEAFAKRLATERIRVNETLAEIRAFVFEPKGSPKRKRRDPLDLSPEDTLQAMKEMGITSVAELIAKVKEAQLGQQSK